MNPTLNHVLKIGAVGMIFAFTAETSSAGWLWDKIWGKIPVGGKIKEMAEAGGKSRDEQQSKLDKF